MVRFVFLVPLPSSWQQNACLLVSFDVQSDKTKNAEELLSLLAPQFEAFALPIITGTNNAEVHRSDRIFMSTPLPHQCRNVLHAVFRQQEQLRRNAVRRNAVPSHLGDIYRCLVLGNNSEFCEVPNYQRQSALVNAFLVCCNPSHTHENRAAPGGSASQEAQNRGKGSYIFHTSKRF